MPNAFRFSLSPFDSLSKQEQEQVRASVDIVYFRAKEVIVEVGDAPGYLYVLIKGRVAQMQGSELLHSYGADDTFDGRALVAGKSSHRFLAQEEVLAYALARETVLSLIASNATFSALLFSSLGEKLSALAQRSDAREMQSLTMSRIDEAVLHAPHYVDAHTDIQSVARLFEQERISHVLVRDHRAAQARLGIFSSTALSRAVLDGRALHALPVGDLASYELIALRPDERMGQALTMMLRHRIHRIVVADGAAILGVLESLDVFGFLSNHSHLILSKIDQAADLDALAGAAAQMQRMVQQLHASGSDVAVMGSLMQEVGARLFERAWAMVAPAELVQNSCLIVMGSQGRAEQLLKTDQDNALILRDGYVPPDDLEAICERFAQALARFGYPPCPGGIMLNNPQWRATQSQCSQRVRSWLMAASAQDVMHLAIFLDACPVSGDASLLDHVRSRLWELATDNDMMLARFASAIDSFDSGNGFLSRMFALGADNAQMWHIKKNAIFPIVHGVRSLALAHRIKATGTLDRLEALVQQGQMQRRHADNLIHSLHFFMRLRLKADLAEIQAGRPVSGQLDAQQLGSLERDLLKDALAIVKRFKAMLRQRFRLDAL